MSSVETVRFGIVGAGAIGGVYAESFARSKHARLVAIADTRREAAEAAAAKVGAVAYGDHAEMLARGDVEAVVLCTPPVSHPQLCEELLERHVHVLCEKPLSIDSKSARQMLATARRTGQIFTMASKFRYVDDVARARQLVDEGAIGEVVLFENAFTSHVDMSRRWNANPQIAGGGVLIDNGTHSVDIMRFFLGPLAELQAVEGKRVQKLDVEDTVRIFVRSVSGVMGSIDLSWSINKGLPSYINIYGSAGTISVGWKESKIKRATDGDWSVFGQGYDKLQAFGSQLDNFALAIRGREPLVITAEDALASVEVIETAYIALKRSQWTVVRGVTTNGNGQGAERRGENSVEIPSEVRS